MGTRSRRTKTLEARPGSRLDLFLAGKLTTDDLTEEELLTGILNDKNGERSGRPANLIPREFHTAVVQRVIEIVEGKFRSGVVEAADNILEIALGDPEIVRTTTVEGRTVESEERRFDPVVLKAAQFVVERVAGKTPDVVQTNLTISRWEQAIESLPNVFEADPDMARSASEAPGITASGGVTGNGART